MLFRLSPKVFFRGIRRMPSQGAGVVVEATFDMEPSTASVMERAETTTPAPQLLLFDIQKQVLTFVWYCIIITTIE